jgi:nicotinate dehydrogenase subunit B
MTQRADAPRSRRDFHDAVGVALVVREPPPAARQAKGQPAVVPANPAEGVEIFVAVWDDGSVTGLAGHVDLGTGLRTALGQIVAEELDVAPARVAIVLGHTACTPNQGATIASSSIQIHAVPLRQAAAQARAWLLEQAAEALRVPATSLDVNDGVIALRGDPSRAVSYAELLAGRHVELKLSQEAAVKAQADYRVVGTTAPRVDLTAKASGDLVFVHDMRVPGMLHGRVVRPPYAGVDAGDFVGNTLEAVDEASIAHIPGVVKLVVIRDFIGIVAEREEAAEAAMRALAVRWKPWPGIEGLDDLGHALRNNPSTRRVLAEQGDVDAAITGAAQPMLRSYVWPYQMHAAIGPSCALADWHEDAAQGHSLTVWAGTQNPHVLRADLARLTGLVDTAIEVVRMEAAGCYGRNCADDVAADAALLARAVQRPVRVQLTREQEHAWEPKGAAQLMQVGGGLNADGSIAGYDFAISYPSNGAPTLALLLTRTIEPETAAYEMGDRTAVPPYAYANLRVVANDMAPILRASWLRGVSALPNSFAHESYIDELATAAGADPVEFRLRHLKDARAAELVKATADRAGWIAHTKPMQQPAHGEVLKGQGFAYARYVHGKFPGFAAAWAAWVADVEVNRKTGEVHVSRVVVGHDAGLVINPAGLRHQVHGNVLQTTSRALKERVGIDAHGAVESREWGSYPILNFREVPVVEVLVMPRPGEPALGAGESASVPGTAAIANAIFDATGVRFRDPPFTPEVVRAALNPLPAPAPPPAFEVPQTVPASAHSAPRNRKGVWAAAGALAMGVFGALGALLGWRPAIAPVALSDAGTYSAQVIARGRELAALGDCAGCHTAPGGVAYAGGREMHTPFGTIVTTNLTPDAETGIGAWSFSAFQRAMREGVSRDGRHLYPAFPYTAFTRLTDDDLMALYAYLMSRPPVRSVVPETKLAFPYSLRPALALWNALYLAPGPVAADPARSAEWNRGAYLVEGLGHCGACHTPRDALGAERVGKSYLQGAMVDGWEAPSLTSTNHAPLPWSADEFYRYLRFGHTLQHGSVAGTMALVVRNLADAPDADLRAMAAYLASFTSQLAAPGDAARVAAARVEQSRARDVHLAGPAQRMFSGACGACHHDGDGPVELGMNLPLALHSSLHSALPDNLLRAILEGVREPATAELGYMPAFKDSLNDRQLAELVTYMRQRFAPDKPAWTQLEAASARVRATPTP